MKMRITSIIFLITMLTSCSEHQKVPRNPFTINRNVTCEDLTLEGYQWMPGVDVIIIGKRFGDTLDYYQMEYYAGLAYFDYRHLNNLNVVKVSSQNEEKEFVPLKETPDICHESYPILKNMVIEIDKFDTLKILDLIDKEKYSLEEKAKTYDIYQADVINKITMDTFNISVYEQEERYYFSSSISFY
ncbi:hypothetical protein LVD15_26210 [Fulvivirga maritima]|uniref:hypothetical protein n=1 Tax=Fulvivirga maritima TaxID=2904247 RepID=UPI001F425006|nr:hypothetical protein [Fulvivirga maritima]UII26748.1 hypothetical protein LVD15_26210 [Fulvivirga maritima]